MGGGNVILQMTSKMQDERKTKCKMHLPSMIPGIIFQNEKTGLL